MEHRQPRHRPDPAARRRSRCASGQLHRRRLRALRLLPGLDHRVHRAASAASLARYRQAGVRSSAWPRCCAARPPRALVAARPDLPARRAARAAAVPRRAAADRLETLEVARPDLPLPGSAARHRRRRACACERGSFTVVTGRIGAGKTTLLQALLGLLPPTRGEIRWNGAPVADPAHFFVPPRSAYTPQVPRLFSETLRDNILMGLPERRGGPGRGAAPGRAGARPGATWPRGWNAGRAARRAAVGRAGAARRRRAHVRARRRAAGLRRPLQRARRARPSALLWERVFARARRDLPGRLAPPRRPAPRRPDHRAQGRRASRPRARWTTCWRPPTRCGACGRAKRPRPTRPRTSLRRHAALKPAGRAGPPDTPADAPEPRPAPRRARAPAPPFQLHPRPANTPLAGLADAARAPGRGPPDEGPMRYGTYGGECAGTFEPRAPFGLVKGQERGRATSRPTTRDYPLNLEEP